MLLLTLTANEIGGYVIFAVVVIMGLSGLLVAYGESHRRAKRKQRKERRKNAST